MKSESWRPLRWHLNKKNSAHEVDNVIFHDIIITVVLDNICFQYISTKRLAK